MKVKIKLFEGGQIPQKQHENDACFDCYANASEQIPAHSRAKIPLGFALGLPVNYEAQIRPRSGLSAKGIDICFGTIDANYTGEICAIVCNNTNFPFVVAEGARICQLAIRMITLSRRELNIIYRYVCDEVEPNIDELTTDSFEVVDELKATERNANGFGSTGV